MGASAAARRRRSAKRQEAGIPDSPLRHARRRFATIALDGVGHCDWCGRPMARRRSGDPRHGFSYRLEHVGHPFPPTPSGC